MSAAGAIPDPFALELWLEVLSYLPRSFRRRMVGVSRTLFELALDDIYEEVRICADDEKSLFAVAQLQYLNIARRVRRVVVVVYPDLPLKQELPSEPVTNCHQTHKSTLRPSVSDRSEPSKGQDSFAHLLIIARHTLPSCCNVQDFKLFVNDLTLQPYIQSFLKSLWHSDSIGPRIRRLDIEATAANISALCELVSVHRLSYPLINVENLDLTFCHLNPYIDEKNINYFPIASFLSALEPSLLSFTISGHLHPHILNLLKVSSTFSRLWKLELYLIFNIQNLQDVAPLDKFIAGHAETIEHILIDPHTRKSNSDLSSRLFVHWLSHEDLFSEKQLPKLRVLELAYHYHWAHSLSLSPSSMVPDLNRIAPNLTALSIQRIILHSDSIEDLLTRVPRLNGVCSIQSLNLNIDILTPRILDLLVRNFPRLDSLEMGIPCSSEDLEDFAPEQYTFCERIRELKYPSWALRYLRVTSASPCSKRHPNICVMEAVASTLSTNVVLGLGYDCSCKPS